MKPTRQYTVPVVTSCVITAEPVNCAASSLSMARINKTSACAVEQSSLHTGSSREEGTKNPSEYIRLVARRMAGGGEGRGVQTLGKSCSFSPETEFTPLIFASNQNFLKIRTPFVKNPKNSHPFFKSLRTGNPGRFGPGSFRPGSFRPIFGVGRFGLSR